MPGDDGPRGIQGPTGDIGRQGPKGFTGERRIVKTRQW